MCQLVIAYIISQYSVQKHYTKYNAEPALYMITDRVSRLLPQRVNVYGAGKAQA